MDAIANGGVRGKPDIDGIACRTGGQIENLIWNYHDDLVLAPDVPVRLQVALPADFPDRVKVTHYRVDSTHSNAYAPWLLAGSPQKPTPELLVKLKDAMKLELFEPINSLASVNREVTLEFPLPRHGLSMIILEGDAGTGLGRAERKAGIPQSGLGEAAKYRKTWTIKGAGKGLRTITDAGGRKRQTRLIESDPHP